VNHRIRTGLERSPNHNRPPEHFFTFAGSVIVGLTLGEVLYVAIVGRPPAPTPIWPWWFSALLVAAVMVWVFRQPNGRLRAAFVFFVAIEALPHAHLSGAPSAVWGLNTAAELGFGVLLVAAFWQVTRTRVKLVALAVLLLAVPIRYWTIYNWHSVLDRARQRQSVELGCVDSLRSVMKSSWSWKV
jgi:hypothetical protein